MKRILLAAAAFAAMTGGALAAGTITLTGEIPSYCSFGSIPDAIVTVDMNTGGTIAQPRQSVNVTCNDPDGYRLRLSSANTGSLVGPTDHVNYAVRFSGSGPGARLLNSPQTGLTIGVGGHVANQDISLELYVGSDYSNDAGTYTDTITVEVLPQ